ncbi:MAG: hypothetical protein LQ340_007632 [Diploschistes diacapsis]|nr:MAG: hypothetical protein LQ340_007632 [Diploschistes diacapsis]
MWSEWRRHIWGGGGGAREFVGEGKAAVVEALGEEDRVGKRVVDGQDDHSGEDALEDGAEDIEDVAGQPDHDEKDGEAFGAGAPEVFDNLGREDDEPAGYGYRTGGGLVFLTGANGI